MSEVRVRLSCGCMVDVVSDEPPECKAHDSRKIWRVWAGAPRIRAVGCEAKGPLVRVVTE
jgi:hypothetical protein